MSEQHRYPVTTSTLETQCAWHISTCSQLFSSVLGMAAGCQKSLASAVTTPLTAKAGATLGAWWELAVADRQDRGTGNVKSTENRLNLQMGLKDEKRFVSIFGTVY